MLPYSCFSALAHVNACYTGRFPALWHLHCSKSLNDVRTLQYMQTLISAAERHLGFFARAGSITGKATLTLVLLGQAYVLKPEIT